MIPAAAAIPFMTLRLSILGKKLPFWPARTDPSDTHDARATSFRDPQLDREERENLTPVQLKCGAE
jgi:hypothetical protein